MQYDFISDHLRLNQREWQTWSSPLPRGFHQDVAITVLSAVSACFTMASWNWELSFTKHLFSLHYFPDFKNENKGEML